MSVLSRTRREQPDKHLGSMSVTGEGVAHRSRRQGEGEEGHGNAIDFARDIHTTTATADNSESEVPDESRLYKVHPRI